MNAAVFSVPQVVAKLLQLAALVRRFHPVYLACEDRPLREWLLLVRSFVGGALASSHRTLRLTDAQWSLLDTTVTPRFRVDRNAPDRCCAIAECGAAFRMSAVRSDVPLLSRPMTSAEMVEALEQTAFVLSKKEQTQRYGAGLCMQGWSFALDEALLLAASSVRDAASSKDAASRTELGTSGHRDTGDDGGARSLPLALGGAL